jgi:hypothetical protein
MAKKHLEGAALDPRQTSVDPWAGPQNGPLNRKSDKDPSGKPGTTRGGVPATNARTRTPKAPTAPMSAPASSGKAPKAPTTGKGLTAAKVKRSGKPGK